MASVPFAGGRRRALLALSLLGTAAIAGAQYPGGATVQPLPAADDPGARLAAALRTLSTSPADRQALLAAGRNALLLGDPNAAAGFFGRLDQVDPRNGEAKAGLAATLVQLERPADALRLFAQATALGVPEAEIASDRGLAHDLAGDPQAAQRDYRAALAAHPDDEVARRRLALSQGIAGDRTGAIATLDPLIRRSDRAAWRAQTFVLAMTGDAAGANAITRVMLPQQQASLQPFLVRLAALSPADKARAVHFGEMPSAASPAYAARAAVVPPRPSDLARAPATVTPAAPAVTQRTPATGIAERVAASAMPPGDGARPATQTAPVRPAATAIAQSGPAPAIGAPQAIVTPAPGASPAGATRTAAIAPPAATADAPATIARTGRAYVPFVGSRYEYQPVAPTPATRRAPGPTPLRAAGDAPPAIASATAQIPPAVATAATSAAVPATVANSAVLPSAGVADALPSASPAAARPDGTPSPAVAPPMPAAGLPIGASASAGHYDLPHAAIAHRPARAPQSRVAPAMASATTAAGDEGDAAPRAAATAPTPVSRRRPAPVNTPGSPPDDGADRTVATETHAPPSAARTAADGRAPAARGDTPRRADRRAGDGKPGRDDARDAAAQADDTAPERATGRSATHGGSRSGRAADDGRRTRSGIGADASTTEGDSGASRGNGRSARDGEARKAGGSRADRAAASARDDDGGGSARSGSGASQRRAAQADRDDDRPAKGRRKAETNASHIYVQVAGGANRDDLGKAWAGVRKQAPDLMKGRSPSTTPLKATNRLLVGPFRDEDEAQGFVNKMAGKGVSGFVFKSAKGQKVEPIDDGR